MRIRKSEMEIKNGIGLSPLLFGMSQEEVIHPLRKIAAFLDCELAFIMSDSQKISLGLEDIEPVEKDGWAFGMSN